MSGTAEDAVRARLPANAVTLASNHYIVTELSRNVGCAFMRTGGKGTMGWWCAVNAHPTRDGWKDGGQFATMDIGAFVSSHRYS